MINEAKAAARRKGAFIMMVEQDLMLARFLAGLHSHKVIPSLPPPPPPPFQHVQASVRLPPSLSPASILGPFAYSLQHLPHSSLS